MQFKFLTFSRNLFSFTLFTGGGQITAQTFYSPRSQQPRTYNSPQVEKLCKSGIVPLTMFLVMVLMSF